MSTSTQTAMSTNRKPARMSPELPARRAGKHERRATLDRRAERAVKHAAQGRPGVSR